MSSLLHALGVAAVRRSMTWWIWCCKPSGLTFATHNAVAADVCVCRPDNAISPSDQDAVFLPLPSNAILRTLSETEHSNADKLSTNSATAAAPAELGASPSPNPNAGAGSPHRRGSVEMPAATMHPASATLKHRRTSSASAAGGSSRKNSQDGQASEKSL